MEGFSKQTEGAQFLKKRFDLHKTPEVDAAARRTEKRTGERVAQNPLERIQNYLDRFDEILTRKNQDERDRGIRALKELIHEAHIIRPENIPESYFELQRRIARERGDGDIEVTDDMRREAIDVIRKDQTTSLDAWVDYLASHDALYPNWTKYWAIRSILTMGPYDKGKHRFSERTASTTAPFPDLNREALAYVLDSIHKKTQGKAIQNPVEPGVNEFAEEEKLVSDEDFKKLLSTENFAKYYAFAIEHVVADNSELFKIADGEWHCFKAGSDATLLVSRIQGHGTGWCTAGEYTARKQLEQGDFYVYFSKNALGEAKIPRLAIRMEGDRIAEVRGVAHQQEIDPYIAPVLEVKMDEFGTEGEKYKQRVAHMKHMTLLGEKMQKGETLTLADLRFLYELDGKILGFGYEKDPRIEEFHAERDWKEDMYVIFATHDDSELAEKLIEAGKDEVVAENLKKFEGLNNVVAKKLIEAGKDEVVAKYLEKFEGLDHQVVAEELFAAGYAHIVAKYLENFKEIDHRALMEKLIATEHGWALAENLEKFEGLDHQVVAEELIAAGYAHIVAKYLENFKEIDHQVVAEKLFAAGYAHIVAKYLENFKEIDHQVVAEKLITAGNFHALAENLSKFEGLDNVVAEKLITVGGGRMVAENLDKFKGLNHVKVAEKLITVGEGQMVAENLDKFKGLNHVKVAVSLFVAREGQAIAKNLDKFKGLNHRAVAEKLIAIGKKDSVYYNLHKFSGLDAEFIKRHGLQR